MLSLSLRDICRLRDKKKFLFKQISYLADTPLTAEANEIVIVTRVAYDLTADKTSSLGLRTPKDNFTYEYTISRFNTRYVNYSDIVILYPSECLVFHQNAPVATVNFSLEYFSIPADSVDEREIPFKKRLWG